MNPGSSNQPGEALSLSNEGSAPDVLLQIAVERVQEKRRLVAERVEAKEKLKAAHAAKAEHGAISESDPNAAKFEKIRDNPQTFQEHVVAWIIQNRAKVRNSMAANMSTRVGVTIVKGILYTNATAPEEAMKILMNEYIFPDIAKRMTFENAHEWTKMKITNPLYVFLTQDLKFLFEQLTAVNNCSGGLIIHRVGNDQYKWVMRDGTTSGIWQADRPSYLLNQLAIGNFMGSSEKVTLGEVLQQLQVSIDEIFNTFDPEWRCAFEKIGQGLYEHAKKLKSNNIHGYQLDSPDGVDRLFDDVIYSMCGMPWGGKKVDEQVDQKDSTGGEYSEFFSKLDESLVDVREQLRVHVIQMGIRDGVFQAIDTRYTGTRNLPVEHRFIKAMDKELFSYEIQKACEKYGDEKWPAIIGWAKFWKGAFEKEMMGKEVHPAIRNFYKLVENCFKIFEVGRIYRQSSHPEEVKQGEIAQEMALVHMEEYARVARNIEVKLSVGDFGIDDIVAHNEKLMGYMTSSRLTSAIKVASEAYNDMQIVKAAEVEADELVG